MKQYDRNDCQRTQTIDFWAVFYTTQWNRMILILKLFGGISAFRFPKSLQTILTAQDFLPP